MGLTTIHLETYYGKQSRLRSNHKKIIVRPNIIYLYIYLLGSNNQKILNQIQNDKNFIKLFSYKKIRNFLVYVSTYF